MTTQLASLSIEDRLTALPAGLSGVARAIRESHRIVELPPDWDGEGGLGCGEDTWQRAGDIILDHVTTLWEQQDKVVAPYRIMPDLEGGIDVHWRSGSYELLLNVPGDPAGPAAFFGNHREKHAECKTSGQLEPGTTVNPGVLVWLAQMS